MGGAVDVYTAARRWRTWLGAALVAVPVAGYFALLSTASVEVPYLDDYDAVVDFLLRTLDEDTASARLGRLLLLHNEHPMLTLRVAVLGTFAITGGINFGALNALGGLLLVGLLAAMFAASTPDTPPAERLLPFAPAALFLIQPQYWMVLLSSTTSLSSVAVTTWAAVTFVALERDGPLARAIAILTAAIATFSLANGILVPWLGAAMLLLRGRPRVARMMAGLGLVLTAAFAAIVPENPAPNLAAVLASPVRLILYVLNFVGGSAGFSQSGWSAVCGALLLASTGFLVWQGLRAAAPPSSHSCSSSSAASASTQWPARNKAPARRSSNLATASMVRSCWRRPISVGPRSCAAAGSRSVRSGRRWQSPSSSRSPASRSTNRT